jgi:hypothetical protein
LNKITSTKEYIHSPANSVSGICPAEGLQHSGLLDEQVVVVQTCETDTKRSIAAQISKLHRKLTRSSELHVHHLLVNGRKALHNSVHKARHFSS